MLVFYQLPEMENFLMTKAAPTIEVQQMPFLKVLSHFLSSNFRMFELKYKEEKR